MGKGVALEEGPGSKLRSPNSLSQPPVSLKSSHRSCTDPGQKRMQGTVVGGAVDLGPLFYLRPGLATEKPRDSTSQMSSVEPGWVEWEASQQITPNLNGFTQQPGYFLLILC